MALCQKNKNKNKNKNKERTMPRRPRAVFPGIPHHVTQRGNRRGDVFFNDADRVTYLDWLGEYCGFYHVDVLAYCLMTNHVHAVLVPSSESSFESVFRVLHTRFAMRINRDRAWTGHLWQGRPFSSALDESYLWTAVRYVERNPVRAGMVARAEDYRWSSAAAHCELRVDPLLTPGKAWLMGLDPGELWSRWLAGNEEAHQVGELRANAERGLPCGSPLFVSALEQLAGRPMKPLARGRAKAAG